MCGLAIGPFLIREYNSSDLPPAEVSAQLPALEQSVAQAKQIYDLLPTNNINDTTTGIKGGAIWLVPTHKPLEHWEPVAVRQLSDMEWVW